MVLLKLLKSDSVPLESLYSKEHSTQGYMWVALCIPIFFHMSVKHIEQTDTKLKQNPKLGDTVHTQKLKQNKKNNTTKEKRKQMKFKEKIK